MVLAVVEDLVAEHCAHGVVTDVVRHSDSPPANNPFYSLQFTVHSSQFSLRSLQLTDWMQPAQVIVIIIVLSSPSASLTALIRSSLC